MVSIKTHYNSVQFGKTRYDLRYQMESSDELVRSSTFYKVGSISSWILMDNH